MMSETNKIDGKQFAGLLRNRIKKVVAELKQKHELEPGLAVVLVGDDPPSQIYVRNKNKAIVEAGMRSFEYLLSVDISQAKLLSLMQKLNRDKSVHGILVQLPLPHQIDQQVIIDAISPEKDVDGFHLMNAGRLSTSGNGMIPCTPLACLMLLKEWLGDLSGKEAVVVGRSNIVGKPLAQLLLYENCTVTICHSRTENLAAVCRRGDILVAAIGQPEMIRGNWIKPGAVVLDVGINRVPLADDPHKSRIVGDVAYNEAKIVAGAITPVPGGVGPMTIACLLANTVHVACDQNLISIPKF